MTSAQFVIDFDGTLFDTHQAISYSIKLTFDSLLPTSAPSEAEVKKLIGSGWGLKDSLVSPFEGAKKLLKTLHARNILIAIVSNKGVAAVETALKNNGIDGIIPKDLIIGDNTPRATRKPDPGSYVNALVPALSARGFPKDIDVSKILVVGDTEADLQFASNIGGARSVWCRYGYGDKATCEKLAPDFTIDSLDEVEGLIDRV